MSRRSPCLRIVLCLALAAATGCTPQQPFYLGDDGDLSHYKGIATELEVPDVDQQPLDEVRRSSAPLSLDNPEAVEYWDLSLEEVMQITLANSKIMHYLGGNVVSTGANSLGSGSTSRGGGSIAQRASGVDNFSTSVYDPAMAESDPRSGTEQALSAFDAQFSSSVFWEKIHKPQNVRTTPPFDIFAPITQQDLGTFQSQLSKANATGGTTAIGYNVYYDRNNSPMRQYFSDWNVDVTAEFRQPLFQGAGVQFNRIAGPGAIPGYNNGVIIARIRTDVALADFEDGMRGMVFDTEKAYWRLYVMYRRLDAARTGRDAALQTWRRIYNLQQEGAKGGEAAQEAQAREQYWLFVAAMQRARSEVFTAEADLRYMMGLAVADGRQIRPSDEPTTAKVSFDWREIVCETLTRNVNIRRQKWVVKDKELRLISAKNYLLPRLDAVGQYRWRGLGDDYWYADRTPNEYQTAMQNLTGGDFQDWQFGLEFSLPIGFRKQLAGVRNAQLDLAKQRSVLRELELETSHDLGGAVRELNRHTTLTRTNYEYYVAAKHEVAAIQAAYETGTITLNVLLDAQRRAAEAEIQYYEAVAQANEMIAYVHYIKGSLLEYNGIWLAEGPWVGKAYFDAKRRARARDAGLYMDYGFTRPKVISQGPYQQQAGPAVPIDAMPFGATESMEPEEILAPTPEAMPVPSADESYRSQRSARSTAVGPTLTDAGQPAAASADGDAEVQLVDHQTEAAASGDRPAPRPTVKPVTGQWKSVHAPRTRTQTTKTTSDESDAYSTSAQGAGAASGWKRM